ACVAFNERRRRQAPVGSPAAPSVAGGAVAVARLPARPDTASASIMRRLTVLVLALAVLAGCSVVSIDLTPPVKPLKESTLQGSGRDKILVVELAGVLAEEPIFTCESRPAVPLLARVREELEKAEEDEHVKAVVLRINSPGGTVTASDILYHEIKRFKERRKIPVVAAVMDVAASGGYYAALAADRIVIHPTSITGSIGGLMLTVNSSGLLEKIGVSARYITSGPGK